MAAKKNRLVEDSKALAVTKLVRNWYATDPEIFEGVDFTALITHLTASFVAGGVAALADELGWDLEILHEMLGYG